VSEFDPYAQSYDDVLADALGGNVETDRFAAYKIDEMAQRLRTRRIRRVLDFGCGVGRSLPFLAGAFPAAEIWGFDPSAQCASAAQSRAPYARVVADWATVRQEAFDCILAANVFHHVPPEGRLEEIKRCRSVLAHGGSLFVFEHNPFNPVTRRVFDRCPFDRDAQMIALRDMKSLGLSAGMKVERQAYTLFLPFRGRVVAAVHRALAWVPLGAQYYVQFAR
jgi:trans-aconitate methyltransferase